MAWTAPVSYVAGTVATAANMNTYVKDDLTYLNGLLDGTGSGDVTMPGNLILPNGSTNGLRIGNRSRVKTIGNGLYFANNATSPDNGTTWNRDDTGKDAFLFVLGPQDAATGQNVTIYRAPSGSNPITWATILDLDDNGKLTGAGIYRPAEVSIAAAGTATFTHGLGALPLLVTGLYGASSGAEQNPLVKNGSEVYVNTVTSTQFTVTNQSAGTKWVLALALL
jgi:hypothetical protein